MTHEYLLWIAALAYGAHIVEELVFDWRNWARSTLRLPAEWHEFYVFNAFVVLYGVISAIIGWKLPILSLSFLAFMIINTIFFHMVPFLKGKRFSPGLITSIVLFIPIASWCYYGAVSDNVLSANTIIISIVLGAFIMAYPIILQRLKTKSFFQQN